MSGEFDIHFVGFLIGPPPLSHCPYWHWSITTVPTPSRSETLCTHLSLHESACAGCSCKNNRPRFICLLYSSQTNSICFTASSRRLRNASGSLVVILFIRCHELNATHIGLPTSRSGSSSSKSFSARLRRSGLEKSHGTPFSSHVVMSRADPGQIPSSGSAVAALVTRGGL